MNELLAVALICSAALTGADCTRDTALDVASAPVHSAAECLMAGQVMAARLHAGEAEGGSFVKVACERRRMADAAAVR